MFVRYLIATTLMVVLCAVLASQYLRVAEWNKLLGVGDTSLRHPRVGLTHKFGKDVVVDGKQFNVVRVDELKLVPLTVPGADSIYSVYGDGVRRLALCRSENRTVLKINDGRAWINLDVPNDVASRPTEWLVAADRDDVELFTDDVGYKRVGDAWKKVDFANRIGIHMPGQKYLMKNGKIFCTRDDGEWGGALIEVDCSNGARKTNDTAEPTTGIKSGPDGALWLVGGFDGNGISQSAGLFRYDGKITRIAEVHGVRDYRVPWFCFQRIPSDRKNWSFGATTFGGIAFDTDGSLLVATTDYGLMRYAQGEWKRLTPNWREGVPVCDLEVTGSRVAVMPVASHGVILVDLKTNEMKFIQPDALLAAEH